ncbi:MAG: gamma carbonic anhydrase family protein [Planctomycetes bacterium]|nr:gamma carbonic anhydrase family protein [Planctomycetota bacterium]MCB9890350.1 gamma carbonic anhydrase family protein [Planctomycetota bacterium]MCB9918168.1 gamma carbonic anhydrase family protein [Planctomycetota bacterium]
MRVHDNMRGRFTRQDGRAMVANNATIVGDVSLGEDCNVWFQCVLRGDDEPIRIGARSNVQDGSVIHVDFGHPCTIGCDVTIGHMAMIHGCTIADGALIGMGSILLTGSVIGEGAIIGAGALVPEGVVVPPRTLFLGVPGKARRGVNDEERARIAFSAEHYVQRARNYL